jgi:hypothetical protein
MSATLFLAICILGCDFLLYFLFQWTYGEKRRGLARHRSSPAKSGMNQPDARPFLVASRKRSVSRARDLTRLSRPINDREAGELGQYNEVRAYRRIAASFSQAKR